MNLRARRRWLARAARTAAGLALDGVGARVAGALALGAGGNRAQARPELLTASFAPAASLPANGGTGSGGNAVEPVAPPRDVLGRPVPLPAPSARIADGWPAHNALLLTLGAADRIVATVCLPSARPWMYRVAPGLRRAATSQVGAFNAEELLLRGAQLAFVPPGDPAGRRLAAAGIATVETSFRSFATMRDCLLTTAALLGDDAPARARDYLAALDATRAELDARLRPLPAAQRPSVLHLARAEPLVADGRNTIVNEWIEAAGGRNAAAALDGNLREITLEQALAWDPDIVVLAGAGALQRPAGLGLLRAVREGRLFINPDGVFPWDRYGSELALQLPWAASRFHPALFGQLDLVARTRDFYRRFFNHRLDDDAARRILAGLPPLP
ncbi:ABC transporter substrate-binding protein [Derxia lacustris]|uniref:ABC transporter substrate-binding protein n=1 Tax=Derxia lacustris TaxID=764842 RepID=UPI00111BD536|nr:ABC transporter substrate-binding protein [Derxia lacustris]